MPNRVGNLFSVHGSEDKKVQLEEAVKTLVEKLKIEDAKEVLWKGIVADPDFDGRTKLSSDWGSDFAFRSAWGACHAVQDRICEILSKTDPLVIVQNDYLEESDNFVGTRLVTYSDGELEWFNNEKNLSEDLEEIDEKIAALEDDEYEEDDEEAEKDENTPAITVDQLERQRDDVIDNIKLQMENDSWAELYEELPSRRTCVAII